MDEKENKDFKLKYERCKSIVLKWETAFSKEKGQQPTRNDFKLAPRPVQVAYLTYFEMKHLLEKLNKAKRDMRSLPGSQVKKNQAAETPLRIFRKCTTGNECVEEYDPWLEKSQALQNMTMDGIKPIPPTPRKSAVSAKMLAALPYLKIHFKTPSKQNLKKLDDGVPFGKLNSKLYAQQTEKGTDTIPVPRGKLETSVTQANMDIDSNLDFSSEIDSILSDVRRAVEAFDKEDFDDDITLNSVGCTLGLNIRFQEPTIGNSLLPEENVSQSNVIEYSEKFQSQLNFHSEKVSFKAKGMNQGWIDRCHIVDADGGIVIHPENGELNGTQLSMADLEGSMTSGTANKSQEALFVTSPSELHSESQTPKRLTRASQTADIKPLESPSSPDGKSLLESETPKKLNRASKTAGIIPLGQTPKSLPVAKLLSGSKKSKNLTRSSKTCVIKSPKLAAAPSKIRLGSKVPKTLTRTKKVLKRNTQVTTENEGLIVKNAKLRKMVKAAMPLSMDGNKNDGVTKEIHDNVTLPSKKRKADEITDYDFIDDQEQKNSLQKKGRKRIRLVRQKKTDDNFVRIDVSKKLFVRGKKKMTGIMNKRLNWKLKKKQVSAESKIMLLKCKKCGGVGHFAKFCVKALKEQNNNPEEIDDSPFPSLEEAARMIWSKKASEASKNRISIYGERETVVTSRDNLLQATEAAPEFSPLTSETIDKDEDEADIEPTLVLVSHGDMDLDESQTENESNVSVSQSQLNANGYDSFLFNPVTQSDNPPAEELRQFGPVFTQGLNEPDAVSDTADAKLLDEAMKLFGYKDFRPGQKEAITRVLSGNSTLVVLSTGSGKSLCYLLPAFLYAKKYPGSMTICISPLVSLMEDQVQSIPPFLSGACLHTNMSLKQRELVLEKVRQKKLQVLLVSPEAVCGGLFGLLRNVNELPPISFACVDEVHCISEWSHNFRPSYLRVCQILRDRLNVKTILGLTATATKHTITGVCEHLEIDPNSVIRGEIVPGNLKLSCSRDLNREEALIALLKSKRFDECDSIIIYCTRREQCERIATLIRTILTDKVQGVIKENSRRRMSTECEAYHAGMSAARRKSVQSNFMAGKIRIVVATVAFGMGVDKSDIRAVIHFNMPKTFESYIQEIGRAGRDGLPAECHLFLDSNKGKDICELKRHIYSNSIDRASLRKLLKRIFRGCTCQRNVKIRGLVTDEAEPSEKKCPGHEVSFSVQQTVQELDLQDENIETLLCYLERYADKKLIKVLPKCYHMCSIQSYGGTNLLKSAARNSAALAAAIAIQREKKKFKDADVHLEFNFIEVAETLGWSSAQMRKELKSLEWAGTQFDDTGSAMRFRKSGILVEFSDLAYRMLTPGTLSNEESDAVLNYLHSRNTDQETMELFQLNRIYQSLFSNSYKSVEPLCEACDDVKSDNLKKLILDYFNSTDVGVSAGWKPPTAGISDSGKEEAIRQDIRKLLQNHTDIEFSSRAIARLFQGISSPCFPAEDWCRNRSVWRRHLDVDFHFLCQVAAQEIC